jgi:hypothetical protein
MGSWSLLKNTKRKPKKTKIVGILLLFFNYIANIGNNIITCKSFGYFCVFYFYSYLCRDYITFIN